MNSATDNEILRKKLFDFITSIQSNSKFIRLLQSLSPITLNIEILGYSGRLQTKESTEVLNYYEKGVVHFYSQTGEYLGTIANKIEDDEVLKRFQSGKVSITVKEVFQVHDQVFFSLLIRSISTQEV